MAENYDEESMKELATMDRPMPGESLTNDPDNPMPFEGPPQYTELREALEAIFDKLIDEANYTQLMLLLASKDFSIMEVTQVVLHQGFSEGLWNPDLMLLLIEPTAYMIMALAERAEIDFNIMETDDEDDEEEEEFLGISHENAKLKNIREGNFNVPQAVLPRQMEEQIEELPTLEEAQQEETPQQPSLLAPEQG